ncbi:MAG: GTP 3',8-cyclase MoaA [Thermodesulfovibrionales bacterium]|jgi:cyclic pyranopterin phosphate synthase|nr:GTP 3',8-cyclase MoaA [Thermodesulfovibrionales bacterium]
MSLIKDKYQRIIDYMRISITDRCNLRCIYCMPSEGIKPIEHKDILGYEEIIRIVRIAAGLGVRKIRLTGGEPLIRKDLPYLVSSINSIGGIEDISLTTNGLLLKKYARSLASAGLRRVNVSLDSLRPERYREITRGGDINDVLEGIDEAENAGLLPIKINMVPIRGFNDDEIEEFARLTLKTSYNVRFIEFMPIGAKEIWDHEKYISTEEIKERASKIAPLIPVKIRRSGPARYFRFEGAPGVVGFISPITHHFCNSCNRLRLTSDGKLRPCLFSETEIDLKSALRCGASDEEIERLLRLSIEIKPEGHSINHEKCFTHLKPMSKIGG